jgi:DNA-binding CsgD family transcriptional regulator
MDAPDRTLEEATAAEFDAQQQPVAAPTPNLREVMGEENFASLGAEMRRWVELTEHLDRLRAEERELKRSPDWLRLVEARQRLVAEERQLRAYVLENRIAPYNLAGQLFEIKDCLYDVRCQAVRRSRAALSRAEMEAVKRRLGQHTAEELQQILQGDEEEVLTLRRIKRRVGARGKAASCVSSGGGIA